MPDLKSEMRKVLSAWEQDIEQLQQEKQVNNTKTTPHRFTPINNVSTETFNHVKKNPRSTSTQVCAALGARGFKKSSVGSLLAQFVRQGQMAKTNNGEYYTIVPAYIPLKSSKASRATPKPKPKVKAKAVPIKAKPQSAGIAALKVEPRREVTGVISSWDADTIIDNIGLKQARALYDGLKKIFGG